MQRSYLMLLWHMHQPFYKDLAAGEYVMPWVRLHALKDYFGMAALLRDFPAVHATFNLVPSLLIQLEEYAKGEAREPAMEVAFRPADALSSGEQGLLLNTAFQAHYENQICRYPRLRELYEKARSLGFDAAQGLFASQEWLDLQVLSQLVWFDEIYIEHDPAVRELAAKGRGFVEDDKAVVKQKELELFKVTPEEYKAAADRGQIELSTSPFYHPILPLLCDSDVAAESHPGVALPRRAFRRPEDARRQLQLARDVHERLFGRRPAGLWPSEGSVSDGALRLAAEEGFEWAATDESVLGRSLGMDFSSSAGGVANGGRELYRPHRLTLGDRAISLFFRDHEISDLIGFVYSRMDPQAAAADLYRRILQAAQSVAPRPAVVSVILDGENAWEFFPGNGRAFLKSFYGLLSESRELKAVTASEALGRLEPGSLSHIAPGSWINANFDVWIGAEEDNRAWDLLWEAREFFDQNAGKGGVAAEQMELARQEIWISEGSDWCWWYGPEHSSPLDAEFDLLYRKHLSNVYRMLGGSAPDELAAPIKKLQVRATAISPTGRIEPVVDGRVTNYFEWIGAGFYRADEGHGAMHGGQEFIEAFYYGYSARALCLRLDFREGFSAAHANFEIRIVLGGESGIRVHARVRERKLAGLELWRGEEPVAAAQLSQGLIQAAFDQIFELCMDFGLAGVKNKEPGKIKVSLWVNEMPLQNIPRAGWVELAPSDELISW